MCNYVLDLLQQIECDLRYQCNGSEVLIDYSPLYKFCVLCRRFCCKQIASDCFFSTIIASCELEKFVLTHAYMPVCVCLQLHSNSSEPLATWEFGADINQHTFTVTGFLMFSRSSYKKFLTLF
jgi:hypothetical protein